MTTTAASTATSPPPAAAPTGIRPELASLAVPVDSVLRHPSNARTHDTERIKASLLAHGQYVELTAQVSTRRIIRGNGTWEAAQALGWSEVAVQFIDVTDEQALAILAADNKASDEASYDRDALTAMLSELARGGDLTAALYDQHELDDLLASLDTSDEVSDSLGLVGEMSREGAKNPLSATGDDVPDDDLVRLTFFFTAEERDLVRLQLSRTGAKNPNDALLEVIRSWQPAS